ncbi:MAG: type II CAAX endopeptidase family protein [Saprospiraceae bacterium]|nr:type II CAAX endopeptidase family protein [Saprospiraceae bacterium]
MRILVMVALILCGIIAGIAAIEVVMILSGESLLAIMDQNRIMEGSVGRTRLLLLINHMSMFLLPALVWSVIYFKKKWYSGLGLRPSVHWLHLVAGIAFLMFSYPIVAKSYEINQGFNLPEWMSQMEGQTEELLKTLLVMETPGALLANIFVIALIPGLGEELIFRGIIQKELYKYFQSPWVAILVASIIFSAMHFQFAGFMPRFFLGMILGLLFYWTNNLWISILVHAFNNAFQVILSYFKPELLEENFEKSVPVSWYALVVSVILSLALGWWFEQKKVRDPVIHTEPVNFPIAEESVQSAPENESGEEKPL